jgi:invasion protein IalB
LKKALLILKKKKQKDFLIWTSDVEINSVQNNRKFFGSFFQKRTAFRLTLVNKPPVRYLSGMKYAVLALSLLPLAAFAQSAGPVPLGANQGKFGDWTAATYGSGAAKACYAFTTAQASAPAIKGRGDVMLTVTQRKAGKDEVTLSAGYTYPAKAVVTLDAGNGPISFYMKGSTAFTTAGTSAVGAFQQGSTAIAKSSAPGGVTVTDNFSLAGFSDAYAAINAACP